MRINRYVPYMDFNSQQLEMVEHEEGEWIPYNEQREKDIQLVAEKIVHMYIHPSGWVISQECYDAAKRLSGESND